MPVVGPREVFHRALRPVQIATGRCLFTAIITENTANGARNSAQINTDNRVGSEDGPTTCQKCGTKYISVAKKRPPVVDPRCEVCNQPFPRMELGCWLHYQRADDPLGPETALRGN